MGGFRTMELQVPAAENGAGAHRMTYYVWGEEAAARTALCVHGLTRNGRDFDFLAGALANAGWRVLCPDMPGRGESKYLHDGAYYTYATYLHDLNALLAKERLANIDWIGTSMGGIIGMLLASQQPERIRKLVLNDIGPFVPAKGLARLKDYVGVHMEFTSRAEAEAALRRNFAPFGITEERIWQHLFTHSLQELPGGGVRMAYDANIAQPFFNAEIKDVDLFAVWDQIRCPVLVLRGEMSDILTRETYQRMQQGGKDVTGVEIKNVGHAPTLMLDPEIRLITQWLSGPSSSSSKEEGYATSW